MKTEDIAVIGVIIALGAYFYIKKGQGEPPTGSSSLSLVSSTVS